MTDSDSNKQSVLLKTDVLGRRLPKSIQCWVPLVDLRVPRNKRKTLKFILQFRLNTPVEKLFLAYSLVMNSSLSTAAVNDDKLVTKKQAADRLAVSTRTIDRMVAMRRLEKIFVGASTRFRKSDIDRIVERGI